MLRTPSPRAWTDPSEPTRNQAHIRGVLTVASKKTTHTHILMLSFLQPFLSLPMSMPLPTMKLNLSCTLLDTAPPTKRPLKHHSHTATKERECGCAESRAHEDELATYRALLGSMANTCRTLQSRIRSLEAEMVTRQAAVFEATRVVAGPRSPLTVSPTSMSPTSIGGHGGRKMRYGSGSTRRHSAPPGSLLLAGNALGLIEEKEDLLAAKEGFQGKEREDEG